MAQQLKMKFHQLRFTKKPIYSSSLLRYALTLRYTSMQSYKLLQEEFNMPSVSLLKKLTHGSLDTVKAAKLLQKSGSISQDVILMFDEMYLQKSQEYVGGELCGANENGMLYKSVLCFIIVGLQNNVPFIVKTVPVNKNGEWFLERRNSYNHWASSQLQLQGNAWYFISIFNY